MPRSGQTKIAQRFPNPDQIGRAALRSDAARRVAQRAAALLAPPSGLPAVSRGWENRAACRDRADRWRWHADTLFDDVSVPLAVCAACPVRAECATAAIDGDEWGIWGGLLREQRVEMRSGWVFPCEDCGARVVSPPRRLCAGCRE